MPQRVSHPFFSFPHSLHRFVNLASVTRQVMAALLVTHDVHQFEVVHGEEQSVEVVHIDVAALPALQRLHQGGEDAPLLLNPAKVKPFLSFCLNRPTHSQNSEHTPPSSLSSATPF